MARQDTGLYTFRADIFKVLVCTCSRTQFPKMAAATTKGRAERRASIPVNAKNVNECR
jgi:hypothetical protein